MNRVVAPLIVLLLGWVLFALPAPDDAQADETGEVQADADDGCETPCPGEGEDGTCPPDCTLCVCCPSIGSAPVLPGSMLFAWTPGPSFEGAGDVVDRLPVGPTSRLFRPPIPPLS